MKLEEYLKLHPKKYLIFDLDETLALLHMNWSTITQDIFDLVEAFDVSLVKESLRERFAAIYLTNRAIQKHGKIALDKIHAFVDEYERVNYSGYTPNKELIEFIKSDRNKFYLLSIWTTNTTRIVQDFLLKEELTNRFSKIITHDILTQLKPEKEGFTFIHIPNTPLSDYLLIGDSINDEGAAKNAGIDFFKIDYFARQ